MALSQPANPIINMSDFARGGREIFDQIAAGEKERLMVIRLNKPVAMVMNIGVFEAMVEEIDTLRDQIFALNRLKTFEQSISHEDLAKKFRG